MRRRSLLSGMGAFTVAATASQHYAHPQAKEIIVFAAASLKDVLNEVAEDLRRDTSTSLTASCEESSTLAKRIENGAPADLFISADPGWMDYLEHRKLIKPWSRSNLLSNRLVLIAPAIDRSVR